MKAIPQEYAGIRYRSRTEARWGAFWTMTGVPFQYEPEGFDLGGIWYVPDFLVGGLFFEVKPQKAPTSRDIETVKRLAATIDDPVALVTGNPGWHAIHVYMPSGRYSAGCIVSELKNDRGAWLAEFPDGGGWALPLCDGLINCAATWDHHPLLAEAGRVQFQVPPSGDGGFEAIWNVAGRIVDRVMKAVGNGGER